MPTMFDPMLRALQPSDAYQRSRAEIEALLRQAPGGEAQDRFAQELQAPNRPMDVAQAMLASVGGRPYAQNMAGIRQNRLGELEAAAGLESRQQAQQLQRAQALGQFIESDENRRVQKAEVVYRQMLHAEERGDKQAGWLSSAISNALEGVPVEQRARLAQQLSMVGLDLPPGASRQEIEAGVWQRAAQMNIQPAAPPLTTDQRNFLYGQQNPEFAQWMGKGGAEGDPAAFGGTGMDQQILSRFVRDADAFGRGDLLRTDDDAFLTAVQQYVRPKPRLDPFTGQPLLQSDPLPPHVQDALTMRGYAVQDGRVVRTGGASGVAQMAPDEPEQPVAMDPTGPAAQEGAGPPERTLYEMAGLYAGPAATLGRTVSGIPGINQFVQAPEMHAAKQRVDLAARDLVRVLQNNPRYAEGERRQIEAELTAKLDILERATTTPEMYRNSLNALDDALAIRQRNAEEIIRREHDTSSEQYRQAMDVRGALVQFRRTMGAAPLLNSPAEAEALPDGAEFRLRGNPTEVLVKQGAAVIPPKPTGWRGDDWEIVYPHLTPDERRAWGVE